MKKSYVLNLLLFITTIGFAKEENHGQIVQTTAQQVADTATKIIKQIPQLQKISLSNADDIQAILKQVQKWVEKSKEERKKKKYLAARNENSFALSFLKKELPNIKIESTVIGTYLSSIADQLGTIYGTQSDDKRIKAFSKANALLFKLALLFNIGTQEELQNVNEKVIKAFNDLRETIANLLQERKELKQKIVEKEKKEKEERKHAGHAGGE